MRSLRSSKSPEVRIIIYDFMVRLTRGLLSLLYLPDGLTFITGLDLAPPRSPPSAARCAARNLQIPFVLNPYPFPILEVARYGRCELWFSAEYDNVKVGVGSRPEWAVKEIWTAGPGGPYVGHIIQLTRSTPLFLPAALEHQMNGPYRHIIAKLEEAVRSAQQETQVAMLEGDTREDDTREGVEESWVSKQSITRLSSRQA